jgi:adenylate cyclase class 2
MREVEVKILNVNRSKVEESLLQLGAEKVFDDSVEAFFFDFKDNLLADIKSLLRLRREGSLSVLTFKKVTSTQGAKVAEETSVEVSNLDMMQKILQSIGLTVKESNKKHRVSYRIGNVHFDLDCYMGKYSYIPEFMEIEAENLQTIHKYAILLGFKPTDCLPWSTADLINYYSPKVSDT